jgi:hypothetical protein
MKFRRLVGLAVCVMLLVGMFGVLAGQIKPVHATGSILRVQGNARGTTTSNSISVTMTLTPTSGNWLIATIGTRGNGAAVSISGITQTGVTWNQSVDTTSGWQDLAIWSGIVSTGASTSITVSLSGNAANGGVADVCEYSGISSSPVDKTATNSSAGPYIDTGTTATTSQANELWIGTTFCEGGVSPPYHSWNPTNGFIMFDGAGYQQVNVAYLEKFVTSTGTANSGITGDSASGLLGCIVTFKLSGAPTGIVRVQGVARGTSTSSSVSVTMGATPTQGNVLIATVSSSMYPSGPATVSSITQTGVTWTKQANNAYNSEWDAEIWYGVIGSGASTSVTITLSATANYGAVVDICEYSGLNTTTFLDKTATNGGSSTTTDTGTTATTTQANELWIGAITTNLRYQSAPTNSFGQFDGNEYSNIGSVYLEKIVSSTQAANSGTTPSSSAYYSGCIATFKAAAAPSDTTAPTYSNPSTNTTVAGQSCNFSVTLADETALANYTFGTNNTGPWTNDTVVNISGTSYHANTTKTLNSTIGAVVQWEYWFADTSNNLNNTGIQSLTATGVMLTIYSPTNTTYSSGSIPVNFTASGGTIDKEWYNCQNGSSWVYVSNQTYTIPMNMTGFINGTSYTFHAWANNTAGTVGNAAVMFSIAILDFPPSASNLQINTTLANQPCLLSATLTDDYGVSGFIFQTNNTGVLANSTWASAGNSLSYSANYTITALNGTVGNVVIFNVYVNDTSNQWATSSYPFFTITGITVTVTVYSPLNQTYTSGTVLVNFTASASSGSVSAMWYNVLNGSSWVYAQNQTYTSPTNMTGFINGASYTFYAYANSTTGNFNGTATVMFSVSLGASTFTLTVTAGSGGTTSPSAGEYQYSSGASVSVSETPNAGFTFSNWIVNGSGGGSSNPYTFNIYGNTTIQGVFSQINFTLTVYLSTGGTTSPTSGTYSYAYGSNVGVTAYPNSGYYLANWVVNGSADGSANPLGFIIYGNTAIQPTFALNPTLTVSSGVGGTTNPVTGTYTTYTPGSTVTIYETASSGYDWSNWLVNGSSSGSGNPLSFTITGDTTVQPVFSLTSISISVTYPTSTTYTSDLIPVQFTVSGGTIDKMWFNSKNGTAWIWPSNQSYLGGLAYASGYMNGTSYLFYEFANNTIGTEGHATVTFSVAIPSASSGPSPSYTSLNVLVSDCTVTVASGGAATALIPVSWTSPTNVVLTQITFQGAGADWVFPPVLPLTLKSGDTIHVGVTVPSSVADGTYSVQVSCQFTFQSGIQSVVSHVNVQVGAASGLGGFDVQGWITDHFLLVFFLSVVVLVAIVGAAVLVRRRRH